jgi:hypothetical protein
MWRPDYNGESDPGQRRPFRQPRCQGEQGKVAKREKAGFPFHANARSMTDALLLATHPSGWYALDREPFTRDGTFLLQRNKQ